jgi:hypothetical protein
MPCQEYAVLKANFQSHGVFAAWERHSMCELASAVQRRHVGDLPAFSSTLSENGRVAAGERHGNGMVCVNRLLGRWMKVTFDFRLRKYIEQTQHNEDSWHKTASVTAIRSTVVTAQASTPVTQSSTWYNVHDSRHILDLWTLNTKATLVNIYQSTGCNIPRGFKQKYQLWIWQACVCHKGGDRVIQDLEINTRSTVNYNLLPRAHFQKIIF